MNTKTVLHRSQGFVAPNAFTSAAQTTPAHARQPGMRQRLLEFLAFLREAVHDRAVYPLDRGESAPALVSRVGNLYHALPDGRREPAAALLDTDRFEVRGG